MATLAHGEANNSEDPTYANQLNQAAGATENSKWNDWKGGKGKIGEKEKRKGEQEGED